jgi:hypothetical protein
MDRLGGAVQIAVIVQGDEQHELLQAQSAGELQHSEIPNAFILSHGRAITLFYWITPNIN